MKSDSRRADSPFNVLAKKYGVREAQVPLRWGIQQGYAVRRPRSRDSVK
jgi:hypothetical protein